MSKIESPRLLFAWIGSVTLGIFLATAVQAQSAATQNQAVTEIIRLQHRAPASIRSAIEPQLDPRGAISQIDNSLIISTSRANLTQLQLLIDELDVPRRQLRLSVDFAYQQLSAAPASAVITTETEPLTRQSIVVTEGESVWFQRDSSTPVVVSSFNEYESGLTGSARNDTMGFGANAELRNNRVILRIAMTQSDSADVAADLQNRLLNTTIELEPGQWFVLNEPPEEDAQISNADSSDFSDFGDSANASANSRSSRPSSTVTQDLLAVQIELL